MQSFQKIQCAFNEYLRAPAINSEIAETIDRRQSIYRDLVYKNIDRIIAETFPITRNIIADEDWQTMIRDFIAIHRAKTPYFLEICQEFLDYLFNERKPLASDYSFMCELAHFEWAQLALNVANVDFPAEKNVLTPTATSTWKASPLVMGLSYSYAVHMIDECYLPAERQPTHLLVYRNRSDQVNVLATDPLGLRLVQLLQEHEGINCEQIRRHLSSELAAAGYVSNQDVDQKDDVFLPGLLAALSKLAADEILFYSPLPTKE